MTYLLTLALWAFIALSVTDAILTRKFLALGVKEANPIMAAIIETFGPHWAIVKSAIAYAAVAGAVFVNALGFTAHVTLGAILAVALMLVVCVRNWRSITKRRYQDALVASGNYVRE